jgi:hypothetical protein
VTALTRLVKVYVEVTTLNTGLPTLVAEDREIALGKTYFLPRCVPNTLGKFFSPNVREMPAGQIGHFNTKYHTAGGFFYCSAWRIRRTIRERAIAFGAILFLQLIPGRVVIPSENENRENEHGDA